MNTREITVLLDEEACLVALTQVVDGSALGPRARGAVERGREHASLARLREITCTPAEAIELDEFFRRAAETLAWRGDSRARMCERARKSLRYAVRRSSRRRS